MNHYHLTNLTRLVNSSSKHFSIKDQSQVLDFNSKLDIYDHYRKLVALFHKTSTTLNELKTGPYKFKVSLRGIPNMIKKVFGNFLEVICLNSLSYIKSRLQ